MNMDLIGFLKPLNVCCRTETDGETNINASSSSNYKMYKNKTVLFKLSEDFDLKDFLSVSFSTEIY